MKVDKIKKTGNKYKLVLDDNSKITTYDDVIIENGLLYHSNVDIDLLNKIEKDTVYYDIYYKIVNLITRKLRSEKEIKDYLLKQNISKKDEEKIISKLKEIGFINDINFAKAYISDHIHLSNDGPDKIRKSLLEHNIGEELINEELNKIDKIIILEKIEKLIIKKTKNSKYTGYHLKQKTINDLINLGYDKITCSDIYDSIEIKSSVDILKEYDKLYKKLNSKYSSSELLNKIKQKLYQKGFSLSEIQEVIDKRFTDN